MALLPLISSSGNQVPPLTSLGSGGSLGDSGWSEDAKFANLSQRGPYHYIAVDSQNRMHVVWDDNKAGNYEIYYNSFDGASWAGEYRLTDTAGLSYYPYIEIGPDDTAHVVWMETTAGETDVRYRSFDGSAWSETQNLTESGFANWYPYIATDPEDNLHLIWPDTRDDPDHRDSDVYYKFFDGTAWSEDQRVTNTPEDSLVYEIALDQDGDLHVVFTDVLVETPRLAVLNHVSYDGLAWSESFQITAQGQTPEAAMTIGSDNVMHVEWYNRSYGVQDQDELYYRSYDISNDVWSDPELFHTATLGDFYYASLYRSLATGPDGTLHIVLSDAITGNTEIYHASRGEGGWSEKIQLTNATGASAWPAVAVTSENRVYVVWLDNRDGEWGLYIKYLLTDPILELMNDILEQLTELDYIIETETQGWVKCLLTKFSDKAISSMTTAKDAYLLGEITTAIRKVRLVKIWLKVSTIIIRIGDWLGRIDGDLAQDLLDRITTLRGDLDLCIQLLRNLP